MHGGARSVPTCVLCCFNVRMHLLMLWRQAGSTGHRASFHTPTPLRGAEQHRSAPSHSLAIYTIWLNPSSNLGLESDWDYSETILSEYCLTWGTRSRSSSSTSTCHYSFIQGNEFIVINTISSLSCYSHESCGHVERLEWLAWFVLGYLNSFL